MRKSYNRLSKLESDALEGELTEDEISQSLQNMKHNKSPGISIRILQSFLEKIENVCSENLE